MKDFKEFGEEVFKTATDYIIDGFTDIEIEEIMEIAKKMLGNTKGQTYKVNISKII